VYYKGLEVLVDAMAANAGTLMLVGEGPLETDIRRRAAERGLRDRVQIVSRVAAADLPAYYHAADIFVLPSTAITETFGVVQIEAMAAGRPVISTNLPTGVPWVNQDGVSGLVVPSGDGGALGDAIRRLASDAELRGRLGAGARARAAAMFSREAMVGAFRHVVNDVMSVPAAGHARATVAGVR
jgi:rhamnosyl/mannosyltransferase